MTLFTAEGLLRAHVRSVERGSCHPPSVVHHAYLRWFYTQGSRPSAPVAEGSEWPDGWLAREERLFSQRAPGNTCLSALGAARSLGERARNDSKGCGTVMRVAPIGIVSDPERAYELGAETSALTHGHPTGIVAGGAFAFLVARLLEAASLPSAVADARSFLAKVPDAEETVAAIDGAVTLAERGGVPTPERLESLGGAWVAEEALAIAIYSALVAHSFDDGVLLAVNHGGDSDSTGSMAGQLLSLMHGLDAIPLRWRTDVELRDVIELLAEDLSALRAGELDAQSNWERYPGW